MIPTPCRRSRFRVTKSAAVSLSEREEVGSSSTRIRAWVASRVQLARADFQAGLAYLAQVESWRCRLAGYAYFARFEGVLTAIERDGYRLRPAYAEARSVSAGLRTLGTALALAAVSRRSPVTSGALPAR